MMLEELKRAQKAIREFNSIKLPAYLWPGGYPLVYYDASGEPLCADCAKRPDEILNIIGADVYYEGPDLQCAVCECVIESAYGYIDEEEDD